MALLRASSRATGEEADLVAAMGRSDGGVLHGAELVRFAEAATRGSDDLSEARKALQEVAGLEAFVLAATTVGIFSGLVRAADSIGIPLDQAMVGGSADFREDLGINAFSGSHYTDLSRVDAGPVPDRRPALFGD